MGEEDLRNSLGELSIDGSLDPEFPPIDQDNVTVEEVNTIQDDGQTGTPEEPQNSDLEIKEPAQDGDAGSKDEIEHDDDDDDDDFGAFSDASFNEFESQQKPPELPTSPQSTTQHTASYIQFPQELFDTPSALEEAITELLSQTFPTTLAPSPVPQNTDVLNERSRLLLERLTALPHLKPHNWKRSSLRRQLLLTLGIRDTEDVTLTRRRNLDDGMQYEIEKFEELGISEGDATKLRDQTGDIIETLEKGFKSDEELGKLGDDELDGVIADYGNKIEEISRLLAVWEYEKKKLENDNSTFEGVVENLVGHTQRLRREETLKSLKKDAQKSKGLGSMFKKKSKK